MRSRDPRLSFISFALLIGAASAQAATLNVAAGGIDTDGCGTKTAPCRSITRAIGNAAAGDKIVVGPGRYGDLDADGTRGEAGEEAAGASMIIIDKRLAIESVEGAVTTLIDAGGADQAVGITAAGASLGKAKKGFTITGAAFSAVTIEAQANGVTVAGVRAVRNARGFVSKAAGLVFNNDIAEANDGNGFALGGSGASFTACRATANGDNGFLIQGDGHVVKGCVASANAKRGFDLAGNGVALTKSVATGNDVGLQIGAGAPGTLATNSFLGNFSAGVLVTAPNVTLTNSNVFGNGSAGGNCGITVSGAGTVDLDKICFGAPTGPGADPADQVCGGAINVIEIVEKVIKVIPKVPL